MKHFSVAPGTAPPAPLRRGAILAAALLAASCGGDERSVQEASANQGGETSTGGASGSGGSAETGGTAADTGGTPATGGASNGGAGASAGGMGGHDGGAGGSPTAGAGGGGSGGVPGTGGATGGAGGDPNTCNPPCGSGTPVCENGSCVQCATGSGRCNGDAPELCEEGQWVAKPTCSGNTPACSNGVCGSVKLTGGIATVADGVLKTTTVRLVEYGLERWPTACGDVRGAPVCVTGGIGP